MTIDLSDICFILYNMSSTWRTLRSLPVNSTHTTPSLPLCLPLLCNLSMIFLTRGWCLEQGSRRVHRAPPPPLMSSSTGTGEMEGDGNVDGDG